MVTRGLKLSQISDAERPVDFFMVQYLCRYKIMQHSYLLIFINSIKSVFQGGFRYIHFPHMFKDMPINYTTDIEVLEADVT